MLHVTGAHTKDLLSIILEFTQLTNTAISGLTPVNSAQWPFQGSQVCINTQELMKIRQTLQRTSHVRYVEKRLKTRGAQTGVKQGTSLKE